MGELARLSFEAYEQLVYRTPEFGEYFWQATPIDLIEHLRLGSRPSRRQQTMDIRQLRAIPWVFAWTQSRHLLSAWYGIGHALEEFRQHHPHGLTQLRDMYERWPFFRTRIDMLEMVLAKTDLSIAALYDERLVDTALRPLGAQLRDLLSQCRALVLGLTHQSELLTHSPETREAITVRSIAAPARRGWGRSFGSRGTSRRRRRRCRTSRARTP